MSIEHSIINKKMGASKISSDASESLIGSIYQFYVALDKCFELATGESIFIEKFGDVSTSNLQIEVKKFSDSLTDAHVNFWNTVNNWLDDAFDHSKFKGLILLTTQDYGAKTQFARWNTASDIERTEILMSILDATEQRYRNAETKSQEGAKPKSAALLLMQQVLSPAKSELLQQIIMKIHIAVGSPLPLEQYAAIKNKYLKGIPTRNKDLVMNICLGTIISSSIGSGSFEITEEFFSRQFQEITAQYNSTSIIFPKKYIGITVGEKEREAYIDENYVQKIREIEYEEAIAEAITNYVITNRTIAEELMSRSANKRIYDAYNQDIIGQIGSKYKIACRNANQETLINQSKNHYDEMMSLPSPAFGTFNDTHISFKNGMIHILANDDSYGIIWKLTCK